ncbi:MAG: acetate--CoA ligase family protein [Candidatus Pacearchaeota archaeon]
MLNLRESFELLENLPVAKWKIANNLEELKNFQFPFYMKANISGHKTEANAVLKCININDTKKNFKTLKKNFPNNEIIIQENSEGIEMIIGIKEDKIFGKVLVLGFGGIFTEIKKDTSFRILPISRNDVSSMIKELKGFKIFNARGKKYDLKKFTTLVEKVAYLGEKLNIKELDLNPVIISEKNVKIVDARIELKN